MHWVSGWRMGGTLLSTSLVRVRCSIHADGRSYEPGDWPAVRAFTRGEVVSREELLIQRPDGSHGILLASAAPVYGRDGSIAASVAIVEDITAERAYATERLRLIEEDRQVKASAKAQSAFLATMNHELRSPSEGVFFMRRGELLSR